MILASSYVGGPRYRLERQQNAMAYVHAFGRPDLFLTMTCNPKWPEILAELLPGQTAVDRPDITARVFELKKAFLRRLKTLFGDTLAHVCALDYQKRGELKYSLNSINIEKQFRLICVKVSSQITKL